MALLPDVMESLPIPSFATSNTYPAFPPYMTLTSGSIIDGGSTVAFDMWSVPTFYTTQIAYVPGITLVTIKPSRLAFKTADVQGGENLLGGVQYWG